MAINEQSDDDSMRQIDSSSRSFVILREHNKLYVDKSLLIKDMIEVNDCGVYLYTRPRRFGKSTNLTMLNAFFNVKYKGNTWFDDLEISKYPQFEKYKNAFPVIHMDLVYLKSPDYATFLTRMKDLLWITFGEFRYLQDSGMMRPDQEAWFNDVLFRREDEASIPMCIPMLCNLLEQYHGQKVIILIDEYDSAVSDAFGSESHQPIMKFLGNFMRSMLKGNDSLQMAYITGIMQIAKESIFSDLNNLEVNNIFSTMSDERFGFTEAEVKQILKEAEHPEKFDEVKLRYDGYRFGDAEVYNPYSVMYYVKDKFVPKPHWANSGGNSVVRWLLERMNDENIAAITNLVSGGTATVKLSESLVYSNLQSNELSIYSLMAMSGYLKAVPLGNKMYEVSIPNSDVMEVVDDLMRELHPINDNIFTEFNRALLDCDAKKMTESLQLVLGSSSYLNLNSEKVYSAIVMTILHALSKKYEVRTEFEQGNGRVDVIMRPRIEGDVPIIFELKRVKTKKRLDAGLDEAMEQIHDRQYYLGMKGKVVLAAMCFWGKVPKIRVEALNL